MREVSVIIPTYNRRQDLVDCLVSVFKQDFPSFEVIVVDDASTDGTEQALRREKLMDRIIYLRNQERSGVSQAKNLGIGQAQGRYLWFLDSDTVVLDERCLETLHAALGRDLRIGSIGCEVAKRGEVLFINEHRFFANMRQHPYQGGRTVRGAKACDYLATCNCFTRADLVRSIGGFNECYFYGYEDAELGKRIANLGYYNVIDPRAAVLHLRSGTSRAATYARFFKNRIRFALWNFPPWSVCGLPLVDISNAIEFLVTPRDLESAPIKERAEPARGRRLGKLGVLLECAGGALYGYLWNLLFLPQTLIWKGRRDFLKGAG